MFGHKAWMEINSLSYLNSVICELLPECADESSSVVIVSVDLIV